MDSHTLIQALIYLGSAALIVPIAVRLGLGSVLGYLIAGCIIGPWGLRLVTDAESILHFAEIGVVLMLFIIGLELDPQRLWKLRAAVFGGGDDSATGNEQCLDDDGRICSLGVKSGGCAGAGGIAGALCHASGAAFCSPLWLAGSV